MEKKTFEVMWSVPSSLKDVSDLLSEGTIDEIKQICQTKNIKAILFDQEGLCCGGISPSGDCREMVFMY